MGKLLQIKLYESDMDVEAGIYSERKAELSFHGDHWQLTYANVNGILAHSLTFSERATREHVRVKTYEGHWVEL